MLTRVAYSRPMRRTTHYRPATLDDMADQCLDIWCWCNGCCHQSILETDMLIRRLGRDRGVPGVAALPVNASGHPGNLG